MRKWTLVVTSVLMVLMAASVFSTPEMVLVKAGSFQMGDEVGDLPDRFRSRPVHQVTLAYYYWIGKHAVTFNEYDAFCDATGRSKPDDENWGRGALPVIYVSWSDAIEYCNWLSQMEGLKLAYDSGGNLLDRNGQITRDIAKAEGYRLPTEAEWEYAASGGHNANDPRYLYAGSNDIEEVAWYRENSGDKTHPVGQKKPNELGLHDMTGNVLEWCHDWSGGYTSRAKTNPIGPSAGYYRVTRGGSWSSSAQFCRVALRSNSGLLTYNDLGFRLARTNMEIIIQEEEEKETVTEIFAPEMILFECPNLEERIRRAQGFSGSRTGPISPADVSGIDTLRIWGAEICSLEGIQFLTNLQVLNIESNRVIDITPLQNLTNLVALGFSSNEVNDITPLQKLTNLQVLEFRYNRVSDIVPLQHLKNLQTLLFDYNPVSDITPLQNLTNLKVLDFSSAFLGPLGTSEISDITPLQNLTNLEKLWFSNNEVIDITALQNLTNLVTLDFSYNQVIDLTPLQNLINLEVLDISMNQVTDIQPLISNPGFGSGDSVTMSGNELDLTPNSQNMNDINSLIDRGVRVSY